MELSFISFQVGFEGVTGNVAFDDMGNRVNYTISIFSGQGETLEQLVSEIMPLIVFERLM